MYWTNPMFGDFENIANEILKAFDGRLVNPVTPGVPPVNLWTGESEAVITALLPGVTADKVNVSVLNRKVALSVDAGECDSDDTAYHRAERHCGSFAREIALPFAVDADKTTADFKDGVLTLRLPRVAADVPKTVVVNAT
jgi:HSP20 family protein